MKQTQHERFTTKGEGRWSKYPARSEWSWWLHWANSPAAQRSGIKSNFI